MAGFSASSPPTVLSDVACSRGKGVCARRHWCRGRLAALPWDPWGGCLYLTTGPAHSALPAPRMSMRSPISAQLALDGVGTMVNCTIKSEERKEPSHEVPQGLAPEEEPQPADPARPPQPQDSVDPQPPAQVLPPALFLWPPCIVYHHWPLLNWGWTGSRCRQM